MQDVITIQKIYDLADEYEEALKVEYMASVAFTDAKQITEKTISTLLKSAYDDKVINGGNSDVRKRQEEDFIASSKSVTDARVNEMAAGMVANDAAASRKKLDAIISMTKAWLYSQSGKEL